MFLGSLYLKPSRFLMSSDKFLASMLSGKFICCLKNGMVYTWFTPLREKLVELNPPA